MLKVFYNMVSSYHGTYGIYYEDHDRRDEKPYEVYADIEQTKHLSDDTKVHLSSMLRASKEHTIV